MARSSRRPICSSGFSVMLIPQSPARQPQVQSWQARSFSEHQFGDGTSHQLLSGSPTKNENTEPLFCTSPSSLTPHSFPEAFSQSCAAATSSPEPTVIVKRKLGEKRLKSCRLAQTT